jgi:hypothetical protein
LAYSTEFQELALEAKFNDSAMISGLYNGLNEEVKDAIAFIATRTNHLMNTYKWLSSNLGG